MTHAFAPRRIAAAATAVLLSLALAACFVLPGKFAASLDLRRDGHFTFAYKGEVFLLGLSKLADMANKSKGSGEFTAEPCYRTTKTGKQIERACTAAELDEQQTNWKAEQAAKSEKDDKDSAAMKMMMGGLDPADPKAAEELAERLRHQAGWNSVVYKGDGLYEVDFRITGLMDHDFTFPSIEKMPGITPFFVLNLRGDGSVRFDSPIVAMSAGASPFAGLAQLGSKAEGDKAEGEKAGGDRAEKDGPPFPEMDGTFVLTTDGTILSNNTEEGPKADPAGKRLEWTINARNKVGPMALIQMGK